jgi:hypothetical protein
VTATIKGMSLPDLAAFSADVKKLVEHEKRATGPTSERGKLRAALNATRHGLAGRQILLPGENEQMYVEKLDNIFIALAPQNAAEAEVTALIGDDLWKLGRLERIERGVLLGRIEELLGLTGSAEKAGHLSAAMKGLAEAITAWEQEPTPEASDAEFIHRLGQLGRAVSVVEDTVTEVPKALVEACSRHLDRLRNRSGGAVVEIDARAQLGLAARMLMARLLEEGDKVDATQDQLRACIAGLALPDKAEFAKLAKYRSMLELGLQRRLATLEQLRKLRTDKAASAEDDERARDFRVRLRLVH